LRSWSASRSAIACPVQRTRCANRGIGARMRNIHLGVFLCVHNGGNGNTEVGGRAPEVYTVELMSASIREPSLSVPAIEHRRIDPTHDPSILRATSILQRAFVSSSCLSGED
jgi:hypothetical protein